MMMTVTPFNPGLFACVDQLLIMDTKRQRKTVVRPPNMQIHHESHLPTVRIRVGFGNK
jgi:hypothetical protein